LKKGDLFSLDFPVTEMIYKGFGEIFRDQNPLHTNTVFAKEKGFREEVMYGNILGGFLSYFIGEGLDTKNVIIHSQEIKYLNPFYLNDMLTLRVEVVDVYDSVNVVEMKFLFENEEKTKIAKGKINIGLI
jgi:3-hydroxybutyryl-CoA dehydratase